MRNLYLTVCPCGSGQLYKQCCGLFIEENQLPTTPESLMRSRYTAYSQANIAYIVKTMRDAPAKNYNADEAHLWAQQAEWLGLQVIRATPVIGTQGFVEFIAHYRLQGKEHKIHELSEFRCDNGRWYYVAGKQL